MDAGAASGGCEGGWTQGQPVRGGVRVDGHRCSQWGGVRVDGHRGGQWCVCVCVCVCEGGWTQWWHRAGERKCSYEDIKEYFYCSDDTPPMLL